ncbi:hypothetical protein MHBO_000485 [Bonamia ostreae]|uniref:Uncharacterized protein n=1 Tax=Bonamia ostreae TaxID=126728 RepID=A0ABV2AFT2_9EUKA
MTDVELFGRSKPYSPQLQQYGWKSNYPDLFNEIQPIEHFVEFANFEQRIFTDLFAKINQQEENTKKMGEKVPIALAESPLHKLIEKCKQVDEKLRELTKQYKEDSKNFARENIFPSIETTSPIVSEYLSKRDRFTNAYDKVYGRADYTPQTNIGTQNYGANQNQMATNFGAQNNMGNNLQPSLEEELRNAKFDFENCIGPIKHKIRNLCS